MIKNGFGPNKSLFYLLNLSIPLGNSTYSKFIIELASCSIKWCDLKLTVKFLIFYGGGKFIASLQYLLLKSNFKSSNLNKTPFVIACAVSPQ